MPAAQLTCSYVTIVNDLGFHLYGIRPTSTDVITDNVASANQAADILRCIQKGLRQVYQAARWSFLRPLVVVNTYALYSTDTITVDVSGNVTLNGAVTPSDGGFPSYSATAQGQLTIPSFGTFPVATRSSATAIAITGWTSPAITVGTSYTLYWNTYPMPTGVDTLEGKLTLPQGFTFDHSTLNRVAEVQIRTLLMHNNTPAHPHCYAETTTTPDPTGASVSPASGSTRFITFYPPPAYALTYTGVGVIRIVMLDSTNLYPLGGEVLADVITASCLAVGERDVQQMDETHPDAVNSRSYPKLLMLAMREDAQKGDPETLGIERKSHDGDGYGDRRHIYHNPEAIYWGGSVITGGPSGWA